MKNKYIFKITAQYWNIHLDINERRMPWVFKKIFLPFSFFVYSLNICFKLLISTHVFRFAKDEEDEYLSTQFDFPFNFQRTSIRPPPRWHPSLRRLSVCPINPKMQLLSASFNSSLSLFPNILWCAISRHFVARNTIPAHINDKSVRGFFFPSPRPHFASNIYIVAPSYIDLDVFHLNDDDSRATHLLLMVGVRFARHSHFARHRNRIYLRDCKG